MKDKDKIGKVIQLDSKRRNKVKEYEDIGVTKAQVKLQRIVILTYTVIVASLSAAILYKLKGG